MKLKEYYQSKKIKDTIDTISLNSKKTTFKYIGKGSLSIQGVISGTTYNFSTKNSIIEVQEIDASALFAEPMLKSMHL
ncbi:hypothetical protein [Tenacibaculum sp. 190130A14a]